MSHFEGIPPAEFHLKPRCHTPGMYFHLRLPVNHRKNGSCWEEFQNYLNLYIVYIYMIHKHKYALRYMYLYMCVYVYIYILICIYLSTSRSFTYQTPNSLWVESLTVVFRMKLAKILLTIQRLGHLQSVSNCHLFGKEGTPL